MGRGASVSFGDAEGRIVGGDGEGGIFASGRLTFGDSGKGGNFQCPNKSFFASKSTSISKIL